MRIHKPRNESKSVSRILFPDRIGVAIIPLAQPLPIESSDLPEGFERAALNAFLFGLAPRGVYLAAHVTTRAGALLLMKSQILEFENSLALAGRTVSPITCDSDLRSQNLASRAGLFSVALVVALFLL